MIVRILAMLTMALLASASFAESEIMRPGEALRGNFTQERTLAGFDKPVVSEGTFTLVAGGGLLWQGRTPFAVTTVITGAGIVQAVDGKERMRLSADKAPFLARLHQMMSGVMAGDWSALREDFDVREQSGAGGAVIELFPRQAGASSPISSIRVERTRFVNEVEIVRPGGDRDKIRFRDQTLGPAELSGDESALLALPSK